METLSYEFPQSNEILIRANECHESPMWAPWATIFKKLNLWY